MTMSNHLSKAPLTLFLFVIILGCVSRHDEPTLGRHEKKQKWQQSYTLGLNALKNRRILEAIKYFNKAVRIQKDNAAAHYYLGVSYLERAKGLASSFELIDVSTQQSQYLQGGFLKAGTELKIATDLDPDHHDAHLQLGMLRVAQNKYGAALAHLKKAALLNPRKSLTHLYLGIAYSRILQNDKAEKHLKISLDLLPNEHAHKNLGKIYLMQKRYDEAAAEFQRLLELNGEDVETRCNLAEALLKVRKVDQAFNQLERVTQVDQNYADAHYFLGKIYLEQGRKEMARREFQTYGALADKQAKDDY